MQRGGRHCKFPSWSFYRLFSFHYCRDSDELDQGCKDAAKLILDEVFGGRYDASQFHKFAELFGDSVFNVAGTNAARILTPKNSQPVYEYREVQLDFTP